jgi:hypothetical protein
MMEIFYVLYRTFQSKIKNCEIHIVSKFKMRYLRGVSIYDVTRERGRERGVNCFVTINVSMMEGRVEKINVDISGRPNNYNDIN